MSLVECPDCKKQISDAAPSCPNCGRPQAQAAPQREQVVTVQQTSKHWKALILLSILGFFASFSIQSGNGPLLMAGSILLFFFAVIGKWWHHG